MDILFEFSKEKISDFILYKCSNRLLKSDSIIIIFYEQRII